MTFTAHQLQQRRKSLGASEIAAVCGIDPFRGVWDVWVEKMGLIPPESFAESDMGHLFERPLLEHYSRKTGVALTYPETMIHPLHKWVSATPDGLASDRVVQVKVVGANMAHKWEQGVPDYVVCQVQWEMFVTGKPLAVVVACVGGTDYRVLDVVADSELQQSLFEIGRRFWFDHVVTQTPPAVDSSEACRAALSARYRNVGADLLPANELLVSMAREYKRLGKQIAQLEQDQKAIANTLRAAIGERSGFEFPGGRVQWHAEKGKPLYKALAIELGATPEQIAKHTAQPERVLRVYIKGE